MTNYEWLLNMGGEERQAWFDAEHVDGIEIQGEVCEFEHETDSRENLESEIRGKVAYGTSTLLYPPSANKVTQYLPSLSLDTVLGWLDRQAAITENEIGGVLLNQDDQIAELQEQADSLRSDLHAARSDAEYYRGKLGDVLDCVCEALRVGTLDVSVVDRNGEVVS